MEPDRAHRVSSLYLAALALHGDAQAVFLRNCPDDVRDEVASLLRYEGLDKRFLENGALTTPIGRRIGAYEILSFLGAGGMGLVYRARDTRLGRDVALKILSPELSENVERRARFEREARLLAALNHQNIGAIYDVEDVNGVPTLVLELVEGETLADRLRRGPLPLAEALDVARQIGQALEAAHGRGIIHRDLKPANVGITTGGMVKVLDFGLAKPFLNSVRVEPTSTITDAVEGRIRLGTPAYMSPEQARGTAADRQSDIWAFGCVLYEMLAGKRAFDGTNVIDVLAAIVTTEPDWDALPPSTPHHVQDLVRRCLDKSSERRLTDISDAIGILTGQPRAGLDDGSNSPVAATYRLPILDLPLLLLIPLTLLSILAFGFISSLMFNRAIGLPPRFGWELPRAWFETGLRATFPILLYTLTLVALFKGLRAIRSRLSSRLKVVDRIDRVVSRILRKAAIEMGLDNPDVLAAAVAIGGASALVIILWTFADLINAFLRPISDLLPEQLSMLQVGRPDRSNYMNSIYLLMVALTVSMWQVFRARQRKHIIGSATWPKIGIAVLALTALCLALPYRLFYHAWFETIRFRDNPCFVLGENRTELLLHCPTVDPPRNIAVDRDDPALTSRSGRSTRRNIFQDPRE